MFDNALMETALRLFLAAAIGGAIGINRELHDKPAGLRTHALVALGAAVVTVLIAVPGSVAVSADALSRVIQGVVTGIGFLGAGVILRDPGNGRVHGLTTAAGVWVTAMFGVACGAGQFVVVAIALVLALAFLILGKHIEDWIHHRHPRGAPPPEGDNPTALPNRSDSAGDKER